jgi:ATP-dependent protease ClpP protease subunit
VVELRINSPGGDVGEGFSIANQIKKYSGKVVAVVEGYCASVATIIALACSEIHMHELSVWMMHRSSGGARGHSEDLTSAAKALEVIDQAAAQMYKNKSGASDEQVAQWLAVDTWMSPADALSAKLIDKVITDAPRSNKPTAWARTFQMMASSSIPAEVRARVEQQDPPQPQAAATPQPAPLKRGNMIKNPKIQALLALGLSAFAQAGALAKVGDDDEKSVGTMLDGIDCTAIAQAAGDVKQDASELLGIKAAVVTATGKSVGLAGAVDALAMSAAHAAMLGTESRAATIKRLLDEAVTPPKAAAGQAQKPRKLSPEQAQKMAADFATNGRTVEDVITCLSLLPALPELNMTEDHGVTAPTAETAAPGLTADEQKQLEAEILANINRAKITGVA